VSIGDRLRRQYVLEYTSKAGGDDKPHALALKTTYRGQVADAKSSFTAPKIPLVLDVRGISSAARVSGVQRIDVAVGSGEARQVELLVDDQSRGIASAPPFTFQWDTVAEKPGIHKVVLRATDASGATTDKEIVLEVAPPQAAQVTGATPGPVATAVPPTTTGSRPFWEDNVGIAALAGLAGVPLLLLAGALFLVTRRRGPKDVKSVPNAPEMPSDKTEYIAPGEPLIEATMISHRRPVGLLPKAKLLIAPGQEVAVSPAGETTIGRDNGSTVVLDDPQASRHHARIVFQDDAYWLEDLGSTNGTRVNGEAVTRHKLEPNEQISVGDKVLTFTVDTP
jgi:hypothetical protein